MSMLSKREFLKLIGGSALGLCIPRIPLPMSVYAKHGFVNRNSYDRAGAPFIKGSLFDWVEDDRIYDDSPYNAASLNVVIGDKIPHYMMSKHHGMVKAELQIGLPNVGTLLHFDAHRDVHSSPKPIPRKGSLVEIDDYALNVATHGGWVDPLAYLGKFKKIVHINKSSSRCSRESTIMYVVERDYEFMFTSHVPGGVEIKREIEWVTLISPNADMLKEEIGESSWAFSVCNDYYEHNYYHVCKGTPNDSAVPISERHLVEFVDKLLQLPKPAYGATNISPYYTVSPNSFYACKFIEKNLMSKWRHEAKENS